MGFQFELPDIGEGVVEAEIQKWFVAEGDLVAEDQPLVEVMTDKATVVIPSPRRGRVVRRFWKEGQVARSTRRSSSSTWRRAAAEDGGTLPDRGPAAVAAHSGPGRDARGGDRRRRPRPRRPPRRPAASSPWPDGRPLATPAVRALARERAIDLQHRAAAPGPAAASPGPTSTAPAGHAPRPAAPPPAPAPAPAPRLAGPGRAGPDERVPLRGLRKQIAERMALSKRTAAHFTFVEQCDATELKRVKEAMAPARRGGGGQAHLPALHREGHGGGPAAPPQAQRRPRRGGRRDRPEAPLGRRHRLGHRGRAAWCRWCAAPTSARSSTWPGRSSGSRPTPGPGGARPEDQGDSTFTITSLGALGGLFATPVLNHPEVGILGVHRIRPTPVVRDGAGGGARRHAPLGDQRPPGGGRPRGGRLLLRGDPVPGGPEPPLHADGLTGPARAPPDRHPLPPRRRPPRPRPGRGAGARPGGGGDRPRGAGHRAGRLGGAARRWPRPRRASTPASASTRRRCRASTRGGDDGHLADLDAALGRGGAVAVGECGLDGPTAAGGAPHGPAGGGAGRPPRPGAEAPAARSCSTPTGPSAPMLALLERDGLPDGGVLHSFSGSAEQVAPFVRLGLHFAFAGPVTWERARKPLAAARAVPRGPAAPRDRRAGPDAAAAPRAQRAGLPAAGGGRAGGGPRAHGGGGGRAHLGQRAAAVPAAGGPEPHLSPQARRGRNTPGNCPGPVTDSTMRAPCPPRRPPSFAATS